MEKKLITEINQIRKMMGLNLLNEAGPWADVIGRMLGGATKNEVELMIGRGLKKILITDIENALTKAASGSAMKKGEIDILKALDAEIKKTGNTLGAVNAKGLKGIFEKAANDAIAAGDIAKSKILKKQMKQIDSSLKTTAPSTGSITNTTSKTTQNAGVSGQAASAGRSKLKDVITSEAEALKILQDNLKSDKFPKSFKGSKNIASGNDIMTRAAQESVGKTQKEAIDALNKSFDELEKSIPDSQPWFKNFVKTNLNPIVTDAKGQIRLGATGTKSLKTAGVLTAGYFLISFIMDYGERVSKLSQEHPDVKPWQRMLIAAGEMLGSVTSTTIETGKGAYETGKEEYGKLETQQPNTPPNTPPNNPPNNPPNKEEKKSSGGEEEKPKKKPRF
jgi:hypothetical protein